MHIRLMGAAVLAGAMLTVAFPQRAHARPLVNCNERVFQSPNSVRALMGWSKRYAQGVEQWNDPNSYPLRACQEAIRLQGSAYCKAPNDPQIRASLTRVLRSCKAWFRRAKIAQQAKAQHKPIPRQAYSPAQVNAIIKRQFHWIQTYVRNPKTVIRGLVKLYSLLQLAPNHPQLAPLFDRLFAAYYGTTVQEATKLRQTKVFDERLKTWPDAKRRRLAIDLLLGRLANPDTKQIKIPYVDWMYLVEHVYQPAIKNHKGDLQRAYCAVWLRSKRRDYTKRGVDKAINSICPKNPRITLREVLLNNRIRLALVHVLAKGLPNEQRILAEAHLNVAGQAGAEPVAMCWQLGDPTAQPTPPTVAMGRKACKTHSFGYGQGKDRYFRPLPFVMAFHPRPLNQWTGLQIQDAIEFLTQSPAPDQALIKKFSRAYRKAKKTKCVAFTVTMQKAKLTRGWAKLALYSVGSNHEVSCRKAKRNRKFVKAMPKNWTNYFDKVVGGKFTGPWKTIYRRVYFRRHIVNVPKRKVRAAVIYVRRKI